VAARWSRIRRMDAGNNVAARFTCALRVFCAWNPWRASLHSTLRIFARFLPRSATAQHYFFTSCTPPRTLHPLHAHFCGIIITNIAFCLCSAARHRGMPVTLGSWASNISPWWRDVSRYLVCQAEQPGVTT